MSTNYNRFALDPASVERLEEITTSLRGPLKLSPFDTRPSTIVRRALACYAVHLEGVLSSTDEVVDGVLITRGMKLRGEAQHVLSHRRENPSKAQREAEVQQAKGALRRFISKGLDDEDRDEEE